MREREIEKKLVMEIRKHGGLALKFVSSDYYAVMQSVRQDLCGNGIGVSNCCVFDRVKEMPQKFTNNRGSVTRLEIPNEAIFARSNGTEHTI